MIAKVKHDELILKAERINAVCQQIVDADQHLPDFMGLVAAMKRIVPEFKSQNSEYEALDNNELVDEVPVYSLIKKI
ncbi:MAG: hypothetical protein ACN6PD_11940, partial [Sphingobacterium sp.]